MTSLGRLWAGWRSDFVTGASAAGDSGPAGSAPAGASAGGDSAPAGSAPAGSAPAGGVDPGSSRGPEENCVFCRILASGRPDQETHVVWRHPGGLVVALLNAYPYTSGHLMVMPVRHVGDLESLDDRESSALWAALTAAVRAVKAAYQPDGLNLGANLGTAAGAGIPGHLHLHVLPRWQGDTNFMTTVADTRVLPEALSATHERVRAAWPAGPA